VSAALGSQTYGILSNPFLDQAFHTVSFRMRITANDDRTWSYEQHTEMRVRGRDGLVDHVDRNTLKRVSAPIPNPLASGSAVRRD
ncbi:MAG: FABP family protein, partial [Acidimicrobiia bacterium]|nr:FABP family protein [Acidimicrobiia bacterium]